MALRILLLLTLSLCLGRKAQSATIIRVLQIIIIDLFFWWWLKDLKFCFFHEFLKFLMQSFQRIFASLVFIRKIIALLLGILIGICLIFACNQMIIIISRSFYFCLRVLVIRILCRVSLDLGRVGIFFVRLVQSRKIIFG